VAEATQKPRKGLRRAAVGIGLTAAGVGAALVAERLAARRIRGRPDPESGEMFGLLPPDDLGTVRSFDGTELAVRAAGPEDAPVVVFLHGVTLDLTTWYYQWRSFSERYRCVLYDQRAHGRSGLPPKGDYSVNSLGRDLEVVLDHAVPRGPAMLVGHSMGGMAILSLALERPEEFGNRVAGVVLADTGASDLLREVFGGLGTGVGEALRRLGNRLGRRMDTAERLQEWTRRFGTDLAFLIARATNFGPDASPSQIDYVSRLSRDAKPEVWVHALGELVQMDLRRALDHVRCPALVVVGDRDLMTPKASAQALRAALPDGRAVVVTGAGHISMMERHATFNEVVGGFADEVLAGRKGRARKAAATP
jgi:pimeloyl-ACP methyl ester carboxylesterase